MKKSLESEVEGSPEIPGKCGVCLNRDLYCHLCVDASEYYYRKED